MKIKLKHHYCDLCGKKISTVNKYGSENKRCDKCYKLFFASPIKNVYGNMRVCVYCGKSIIGPPNFCCNPLRVHAKSLMLMRQHPKKIKVLRTCKCKAKRKIRHHPDHIRPYDVMVLCGSCHSKEHLKDGSGWGRRKLASSIPSTILIETWPM